MIEHKISVLFNALEEVKSTNTIDGNFTITELTLAQQKELISGVFDQYEAIARIALCFNNIIKQSVTTDKPITVRERPYLLRALRDLILSPKFTREENEEVIQFELTKNNYKKVEKVNTSDVIEVSPAIRINIQVPTLEYDDQISSDIINTINSYKRSLNNKAPDAGYITSLYYIFEIIRYIDSIVINDDEYKFANMVSSERKKCVEKLPKVVADKIVTFIEKVKELEKVAFTAKNIKTKEEEVIMLTPNIFSAEL